MQALGATSTAERIRLLGEAVTAMKACLEVNTAEARPEYHAARTGWIKEVESEIEGLKKPAR